MTRFYILVILMVGCGNEHQFYPEYNTQELHEAYPETETCEEDYNTGSITFEEFAQCMEQATAGTLQIEMSKEEYDRATGKEPEPTPTPEPEPDCVPKGKGKAKNCKKGVSS